MNGPDGIPLSHDGTRDRVTVLLGAAVLLVPALLLAVAADAPHALLFTGLGCLWAVALRQPWPLGTRTIVYSLTATAVLAVLGDQIVPVQPERFFLVPAHILGPLLLYLGAALLFLPQGAAIQSGIIAAACLVMLLAGNRMLSVPPLERLAWLDDLLPPFFRLYAWAAAAEILLLLGLLPRTEARRAPDADGRGPCRLRLLRLVLLAVALALGGGAALGLRWSAIAYERFVARAFGQLFDLYLSRQWWRFFESDVDLWQTLPPDRERDAAVVLRIRADQPPGYLRGRAYRTYANGRWKAGEPVHSLAAQAPARERLAFSIFVRPEALVLDRGAPATAASPERLQVYPTGRIASRCVPAPGGAREVRAAARELKEDRDGSLIPDGWEWRAGYGVAGTGKPEYGRPRDPGDEYLEVPPELAADLRPLLPAAARAAGGQPPTAQARIDRVVTLLDDRCAYALGVRFPSRTDPVLQFLGDTRRGHCELFASAAVLLLRLEGVPARYVTGFVCLERHPRRGYWLARLRHAHAWAEAWLAEEQRWVLVEATPGTPERLGADTADGWGADWDWLAFQWQRFVGWLKQGYAAVHILGALAWVWHRLLWLGANPARAMVGLGVLLVVTVWRLAARRRRRRPAWFDAGGREALCRAWLRVERRLARRAGRRPLAMTVRAFARQAAAAARDPGAETRYRDLVERYEQLRYRVQPPTAAEVEAFVAAAEALLAPRPAPGTGE